MLNRINKAQTPTITAFQDQLELNCSALAVSGHPFSKISGQKKDPFWIFFFNVLSEFWGYYFPSIFALIASYLAVSFSLAYSCFKETGRYSYLRDLIRELFQDMVVSPVQTQKHCENGFTQVLVTIKTFFLFVR